MGRALRLSGASSARVRGMFAHSNQNWWWTAHPAAH
ncbi:trp operon leader peptide [Streptomyces sp. NPDC059991]